MADRDRPMSRYSRRFREGPQKLGFGVDRVMRHLDAPEPSVVEAVFSEWSALVGEVIGSNTKPVRIKDGVLLVEVQNQAWASEMQWMAEELVRQIQAKLDTEEVTSITVRLAR